LAEDNTSIRELTEVFKPLHASEYLKQQARFSKDFRSQLKKTLDSLAYIEKKDANGAKIKSAGSVNLNAELRRPESPTS